MKCCICHLFHEMSVLFTQLVQCDMLYCLKRSEILLEIWYTVVVFNVVLLFYVHGKHLRSCRDGQLT